MLGFYYIFGGDLRLHGSKVFEIDEPEMKDIDLCIV